MAGGKKKARPRVSGPTRPRLSDRSDSIHTRYQLPFSSRDRPDQRCRGNARSYCPIISGNPLLPLPITMIFEFGLLASVSVTSIPFHSRPNRNQATTWGLCRRRKWWLQIEECGNLPDMQNETLDPRRKWFRWGLVLAWVPLFFLVLPTNMRYPPFRSHVTGLADVVGDLINFGFIVALVLEVTAIVLLLRSLSREKPGRTLFCMITLGCSALVLATLGFLALSFRWHA